jgi:hypothetical protein
MALQMVKPTSVLSPLRQALKDNIAALRDLREQVNAITAKDRAAVADQALAIGTENQITTITEDIDQRRADCVYNGDPPPDVTKEVKQLARLQQVLKSQSDVARAAERIRVKFAADLANLNDELGKRGKAQPKLLFDVLREDCLVGLAQEFLQAEQAFLAVHRKVFAAALAVDVIAKENQNGLYCNSGNINMLHISRPNHPAFDAHPDYTVEQRHAAHREYVASAERDAAALVTDLLSLAD